MTANTHQRRLAPVVLAVVLLPATMPVASASFTRRLGVAAGVAVAPAEKTPRPPATQAVGDLPTGLPVGPTEPVIEPQPTGPTGAAPTGHTGAAPADGPPSSAPQKAPGSGNHGNHGGRGNHGNHGNHADHGGQGGQGKDPHEPCPATGCAPGGGAPPPAGGAPDTGAAAVAPPLPAIDPYLDAAATAAQLEGHRTPKAPKSAGAEPVDPSAAPAEGA